ncbi:MAG: hypothetical protein OXU45_05820 [Candidatus Melainabacteria bacterium]|nr:hypothetical protein [Candidatus Melainabacteria bacterium]
MVDKSLSALQFIAENNDKVFKEDQKKSSDKINQKLLQLEKDRSDINPMEAMDLRGQAVNLDKVANYADDLANHLEKNKKQKLEKKELGEVKEALMESLGIPAEFVDQLSILVKAGPEALREAANVYREKAAELRERADMLTMEVEQLDTEITRLKTLKETIKHESGMTSRKMNDFVAEQMYRESLRDKADEVLKEVLESILGEEGHEN